MKADMTSMKSDSSKLMLDYQLLKQKSAEEAGALQRQLDAAQAASGAAPASPAKSSKKAPKEPQSEGKAVAKPAGATQQVVMKVEGFPLTTLLAAVVISMIVGVLAASLVK